MGFNTAQAIEGLLKMRPDIAQKRGWQQAMTIGMDQSTWSQLKHGQRPGHTFDLLVKLCRGFQVDLETLLRLGGMPEEELKALLPYLKGLEAKANGGGSGGSQRRSEDAARRGLTGETRVDGSTDVLFSEPGTVRPIAVPKTPTLPGGKGNSNPGEWYSPSESLTNGGRNIERVFAVPKRPKRSRGRRQVPLVPAQSRKGA